MAGNVEELGRLRGANELVFDKAAMTHRPSLEVRGVTPAGRQAGDDAGIDAGTEQHTDRYVRHEMTRDCTLDYLPNESLATFLIAGFVRPPAPFRAHTAVLYAHVRSGLDAPRSPYGGPRGRDESPLEQGDERLIAHVSWNLSVTQQRRERRSETHSPGVLRNDQRFDAQPVANQVELARTRIP